MSVRVGVSHSKSPTCLVSCSLVVCKWRYVIFCLVTLQDHKLLTQSHHAAKSDSFRNCGSGDISFQTFLVIFCKVTWLKGNPSL